MFQLDMRSGKSVYEQIIDNIKELIMTGILPEESRLPSVRDLSRQLTINPNTVQKAFRELEREGYIYTVSGRGTFVSSRSNIAPDYAKVKDLLAQLAEDFKRITYLGIPVDEARELAIKEIDLIADQIKGRSK